MRALLICLCLAAATVAAYFPVHRFEFVHFDDDLYVYDNPNVSDGLSRRGLWYAVSDYQIGNYHPLTLLSLQLDATLFGQRAGAFHVVSLLLHVINVLLLFGVLRAATGDDWPSAFVAGLFAIHPTHVESVAWISERKDVLSIFFLLLAMRTYISYCRADRTKRQRTAAYVVMTLCFILGLLAKSMIVTFPFLLLLLDYWPLRRLVPPDEDAGAEIQPTFRPVRWRVALLEKTPLLILAGAASVLAVQAQHGAGMVVGLDRVPAHLRLVNTFISYERYLGKIFWPVDLAAFYPYRSDFSATQLAASIALLLLITAATIWLALRGRKYLIVGWLWFIGTLVPVIGLVQVGGQSMADRYLYLPLIGLGIIAAWVARDLWIAHATAAIHSAIASVAVAILVACGITTRHQIWFWHDTRALMEHAPVVVNGNAAAHVRLGALDALDGNASSAVAHYEEALRVDPHNWAALFNYGNLLLKPQPAAAIERYRQAADVAPDPSATAQTQNNWGNALIALDNPAEAFQHFRLAEQFDPGQFDPHYNLAQLMFRAGKYDIAAAEFRQALRIKPDHSAARRGLEASEKAAGESK